MEVMRGKMLAGLASLAFAAGAFANDTYTRVAFLDGLQEVPPNNTGARGYATFQINPDTNTVNYRIAFSGLSAPETAAHVHGVAGPGVNAGVLFALPAGNPKVGSFTYAEAMQNDLLNGRMYVNIHTAAIPTGEIRGQIVSMVADLDGGQETPPVATPARGVGLFNINTATNQMEYYIIYGGLGSPETAAHIHGYQPHGLAAGVVHPLPSANPKVGTWNYPQAEEQRILDGMTYVNIHTAVNGPGEIRGQIVSSVNPMDSLQETPPIPGAAAAGGGGLVAFNRATNTLTYDMRHQGLLSAQTAAHIHGFAAPGASAGVLHNIGVGARMLGTWAFGAGAATNVFNGLTYFNVHTVGNAPGEIRGQIREGDLLPDCPVILAQPTDVTAAAGATVSFAPVLHPDTPGPLNFQWRRNGTDIPPGQPRFSGQNTANLTINPVDPADEGTYDVVITNGCGKPTISAGATLDVTGCDSIDFNGDGLFPDNTDLEDFLSVFGGGPCSTGTCGDIDFNNDGL
ncbi:MAG TPA: CHRD domain-containing protein, partial [Phycisphaerales bacterium]|nr:CHRD domain-containing protein [Phycisphaerales bacterium]